MMLMTHEEKEMLPGVNRWKSPKVASSPKFNENTEYCVSKFPYTKPANLIYHKLNF